MNTELKNIASLANASLTRPQFVFRPETLNRAIDCFKNNFASKILFAVKTNPE